MNLELKTETPNIYNPEAFREQGHKIIDMLADYLSDATSNNIKQVLPPISPNDMLELWDAKFEEKPSQDFEVLIEKVIKYSHHLHSPNYIKHSKNNVILLTLKICIFEK